MKQAENLTLDDDLEGASEHEDWEFEYTQNIAEEFLDQELMPALDYFDYHNPDENYVNGMATFSLFIKLAIKLNEEGYSVEDLKTALDDTLALINTEIVH